MNFKDFLYHFLYPAIGNQVLHALCRTLKIQTVGEDAIRVFEKKKQPVVYAFWHGRHFLLVHKMGHRGISVVVSPSHDGTLIAQILKKSGFGVVRGSSHRNPVRALVEAVRQMRQGQTIAFTVDGPKGPAHQVKPGAVYLAKRMRAPMIPVSVGFSRFWQLRSWDRYRIPKPFSRAVIVFGTPYTLDDEISESAVTADCETLRQRLNTLSDEADRAVLQEA